MDLDWGTVPSWVGGLATACAVIFAGVEIRRANRARHHDEVQRRQDVQAEREANARAVSVRGSFDAVSGGPMEHNAVFRLSYKVKNSARFPITQTVLLVGESGTFEDWADQRGTACEVVLDSIAPGEDVHDEVEVRFAVGPHPSEFSGMLAVLFTDAWGQHWYSRPPYLVRREQPARNC